MLSSVVTSIVMRPHEMSGWRQYLIGHDYYIRIVPTFMVEICRHEISRVFVDNSLQTYHRVIFILGVEGIS